MFETGTVEAGLWALHEILGIPKQNQDVVYLVATRAFSTSILVFICFELGLLFLVCLLTLIFTT